MNARFPTARPSSTRRPPARRRRSITGLVPHRRPAVRHDLQLPLDRLDGHRRDRAARPRDPHRQDPHRRGSIGLGAGEVRCIMGVPYYGYDWPVTSTVPNATVRSDKTKYGAVKSVTYASARDVPRGASGRRAPVRRARGQRLLHVLGRVPQDLPPGLLRGRAQRSPRSTTTRSTTGLGGVGIWTLDNDRGYRRSVERAAASSSTRPCTGRGSAARSPKSCAAPASSTRRPISAPTNTGTVPLTGYLRWTIRNRRGE